MIALPTSFDLRNQFAGLSLPLPEVEGQVTEVSGLLVEGTAFRAAVGDLYRIASRNGPVLAEVVALRGQNVLLMPFGHLSGLQVGAALSRAGDAACFGVGNEFLGRVIDPLGRPLDGKAAPKIGALRPVQAEPLLPMQRRPVNERLQLGVRTLDAFVPCGRGQRLGIFAGPGVGKSVLLGMIARATAADVIVLALVGERGREVGHFVDEILGPEGLKRSVVVVSTSDRPPPERLRAAFAATAMAEHFRDQGANVLLFVDSLTRFAMAQREIGLAIGEPPATKGYPPSVFSLLPKLLERVAPARGGGSITGLYTVLVEGDDLADPVADAARSLLDGHIVLSRQMAMRGHYPAVDIVQSLSRLESELTPPKELAAARLVRGWLSRLDDAKDLLAVGAYLQGADPVLDVALRQRERINLFSRQEISQIATLEQTSGGLLELVRTGS
jgi:flagellum-specific ATP synthase